MSEVKKDFAVLEFTEALTPYVKGDVATFSKDDANRLLNPTERDSNGRDHKVAPRVKLVKELDKLAKDVEAVNPVEINPNVNPATRPEDLGKIDETSRPDGASKVAAAKKGAKVEDKTETATTDPDA